MRFTTEWCEAPVMDVHQDVFIVISQYSWASLRGLSD